MAEQMKFAHAHCAEAVREVARRHELSEYTSEVRAGARPGESCLGQVYEVSVRARGQDRTLHLVVKCPPSEDARDHIPINVLYSREVFTYNVIFKAYKELQESIKVSEDSKFHMAECHLAIDADRQEVVVLEDLRMQGFRTLGKARVELSHALLVVAALANMHALSFVLQHKDPNRFSSIIKEVPDFTRKVRTFVGYAERSLELALRSLGAAGRAAQRERLAGARETYAELLTRQHVDQYSVVSHNDSWICNAMFKFQGSEPVDIRLLDYQLVRYGPAAVDLLYFLFTSTDAALRRAHYRYLLRHYHATLNKCLSEYGLDVERVFPEAEFYKQVEANALYGLVAGVIFAKPMASPVDQAMDLKQMISNEELTAPAGEAHQHYLDKVSDIVQDCIDYGYI